MKKTISALVLLATFYMVVSDGMMLHFGLELGHQFAFNIGAFVFIFPVTVFTLMGCSLKEEAHDEQI
jgi:hypothetical protein